MKMKIAVVALTAACAVLAATSAVAAGPGAPNCEKLGWRVAVQAWSFNKFTVFEAIDKTASMGLKYIELFPGQALSPEEPKVHFNFTSPKEVLDKVKAKLDSAGVKVVNFGVVGIPKVEERARKVFDFAKYMGIETLVSEPAADELALLDKLTAEYNIRVAIHNHPKESPYWNYEAFLAAINGHSDRIGACADTGHWMRSGLVSLDALKAIKGHIVSLHFKDLNIADKDAHDVVWGTGVCDAKAMVEELKNQNFKGVISIEYEHNWDNNVPDIAQCVAWLDAQAAALAK